MIHINKKILMAFRINKTKIQLLLERKKVLI
jgi:hypothetical protein